MVYDLSKLKIEEFVNPSNIDKLKKAIDTIIKVQEKISALKDKDGMDSEKIRRIGTVLTAAILKKVESGKFPTDFTGEDWEDVFNHVSEYGIDADETIYSAYVFMLYAWFIDRSADRISSKLSVEKQVAITNLSDDIKSKTEQLKNGEISEVDYIDSCLWICLEAMIKLLSGTIDAKLGFYDDQVAEAAMILAFEYGRFVLYKKEDAILTEYLENQKILDVELAMKYEEYVKNIEQEMIHFEEFIESAFTSNMGERLRGSAQLAMVAGVDERDVLKTTQDVDNYFL